MGLTSKLVISTLLIETVQNLGWSACSPKRPAGPALGVSRRRAA
jgi:hypothetical protein